MTGKSGGQEVAPPKEDTSCRRHRIPQPLRSPMDIVRWLATGRDAEAGRGRLTVVVQRFRFFHEEFVMSTALLLRIASVISLVFTAGHTLGGRRSWSFSGEAE